MKRNEFTLEGNRWYLTGTGEGIAWEDGDGINFHHRDVRWLNAWSKVIGDVRLNQHGKIIGDE